MTNLNDLSDVTVLNPATGELLRFDGSEWVNVAPVETCRFTYDSSFIENTINEFKDWSAVVSACQIYADAEIHFVQDETLPIADMPVGGWDLNGASLHGNGATGGPAAGGLVVTLPDGFILDEAGVNPRFLRDGLSIISDSTSPVLTVTGSTQFRMAGVIACSAAEFFDVTTSGFVLFAFEDGGGFQRAFTDFGVGATDYEVVNVSGTPAFWGLVHVEGFNFFANSTIRGTTGGFRVVQSVLADLTEGTSQPNLTGGLTVVLQTRAADLGYTPGTPGDWSPSPDDVAQALDQLAAGGGGNSTSLVQVIGDGTNANLTITTGLTTPTGYEFSVQLRDYAVDRRELPVGAVLPGSGVTYLGNDIPTAGDVRFNFTAPPNTNECLALIVAVTT